MKKTETCTEPNVGAAEYSEAMRECEARLTELRASSRAVGRYEGFALGLVAAVVVAVLVAMAA